MTAIQVPNKVADLIRNDAPAAEARNALGLGSIATHDEGEFEPAGAGSSVTADQLGVYTISQVDILLSNRQPVDGDLTALAALAGTGFAVRTGVDSWTVRILAAGDIPDLSATYSVVSHTHAGLSTAIASGSLWGGQGSGVPAAVAIGSGLSLAGGTLTATGGGGGGGLAVGSAVSGGVAGKLLYEDASQNLAVGPTFTGATLALPDGNASAPSLGFASNPQMGFYGVNVASIGVSYGAVPIPICAFDANCGVQLPMAQRIAWTSVSTLGGANDTGLGRSAAGVVEVNNGSAGTFRQLKAGGFAEGYARKTADYTLTQYDGLVAGDATTAAFAVTLPSAAATLPGRIFRFKKVDSSINAITITRAGADTIDGATTYVLSAQWKYVALECDGVSAWFVVANN